MVMLEGGSIGLDIIGLYNLFPLMNPWNCFNFRIKRWALLPILIDNSGFYRQNIIAFYGYRRYNVYRVLRKHCSANT